MRNNPKTAEEMYSDTRSSCMSYSDFLFLQNEDLRKKVERLQEQLDEAVKIVQMYQSEESNKESLAFLRKWGYKNDVDN